MFRPEQQPEDTRRPSDPALSASLAIRSTTQVDRLVIRPIARSIKRRRQVSTILRTSGSLAHLKTVVRGTSFSHAH
jgi:hypothetical protein